MTNRDEGFQRLVLLVLLAAPFALWRWLRR